MNKRDGFRTGGPQGAQGTTLPPIYNPEALLNFWTAFENRNAQQVKWLALGDSWTMYATVGIDTPPGTWADGYGPQAQSRLLSAFPVTGNPPCGNWYPVYNNSAPGGPSPWAVTGSPGLQNLYGPNMLNHHITAAYTATLVVNGTSADLWFAQDATLSGTFSWQVDSGSVTNVTVAASGLGHAVDGHLTNISLGASGSHTITVKWVSGDLFFAGGDVFDGDETAGLHLISAGHGTWGATDWETNDVVGSNGISQTLSVVNPDLITIMLGINDWGLLALPAVNFDLNLITLIGKIQAAAPNASVVLIAVPRPLPVNTPSGTWQQFVGALQGVATQYNYGLIDLSAAFPWQAAPNQAGFWLGTLHPSTLGHHQIGAAVATGLSVGYGQSTRGQWPQFFASNFTGTVTTTVGTLATTPVLPVGMYRVGCKMTAKPSSSSATVIECTLAAGTATAVLLGSTSGEAGFNSAETLQQRNIRQLGFDCFVDVRSPGTLIIKAIATGASVTVLNNTDQNSFARASGYFIEALNNGL